MQKWEYLILGTNLGGYSRPSVNEENGEHLKTQKDLNDYLRELGEKGWELVAVRNQHVFLKRPIE